MAIVKMIWTSFLYVIVIVSEIVIVIVIVIVLHKVRCVVRAHPPANVDWVKQGETIETGDNNEDWNEYVVDNDEKEDENGVDADYVSSLMMIVLTIMTMEIGIKTMFQETDG